jgi:hypothetical protein
MPQLFIIDEWSEQPWWNTGGTRDKKIYLNPEDGQIYYFKQSYRKGEKDYKYEFWSEIIAYEVGVRLGFDVLSYHVAKRGEVLGCISKSMFSPDEELVEGGKYLQAFDPTFRPEETALRYKYDFQLIMNSMHYYRFDRFIWHIIDMIVFDAFIGNSDRHQENWAFITGHSLATKAIKDMEYGLDEFPENSWVKRFYKWLIYRKGEIRREFIEAKLVLGKNFKFAPIYDSGCCFGRELADDRVIQILEKKDQLASYVDRGKSEIHWNGEKVSHFQLLEHLLTTDEYKKPTLESISKVIEKFDSSEIKRIIFEVDEVMESSRLGRHLPIERKKLIWELLALRHQRIRDIYLKYQ